MCFNKRFRSVIPGLRSVIPAKAGIHILTLLLVATPLHAKALNVVATSSDLATIAQAVGGSHVKVHALVRGSTDLHSIVPKPSMVVQVRNADLLLRIGMYQDGWVNSLIQTARNPKVFPDKMGYLDASTAITALDVPTGNIDGGKGDIHIAGNPHYWISPTNAIKIAGLVYDHLVRLDPTHHTQFLENLNAFKASVTIKMPEWENKMSLLRDTPIVSYHSTWRYFLNDFGLFAVAKLEPIPGVPPTAKHIEFLQNTIKPIGHATKVIIAPYYNRNMAASFAANIQADFIVAPTSVEDGQSYANFIDSLVTTFSGKQ